VLKQQAINVYTATEGKSPHIPNIGSKWSISSTLRPLKRRSHLLVAVYNVCSDPRQSVIYANGIWLCGLDWNSWVLL